MRVFLGGEEGLCVIFLNKLEGEESGMVGLNHKTFNPNLYCFGCSFVGSRLGGRKC